MPEIDKRVDAYIAKAGAFAKPILSHRLATAMKWMGEGKVRNWKYLRK